MIAFAGAELVFIVSVSHLCDTLYRQRQRQEYRWQAVAEIRQLLAYMILARSFVPSATCFRVFSMLIMTGCHV